MMFHGFSVLFFKRMQVNVALASKLLTCQQLWKCHLGSGATDLLLGQQRVPEFSNDFTDPKEKTILRSKRTYCFLPFPTEADCSGLFFGKVVGFFWFLSLTLDRTDLQFSFIQVILPKRKDV